MTFEAKAKDFKICPRGRPRGLHLWHSHLSYSIIIRGLTYKSYLGKSTPLQNKTIRAVVDGGGVDWNESSSPLCYKFKVLKLHNMYEYEVAKYMHCVENKNLLTPLMNFFDNAKNDLYLNTRSRHTTN